MFLHFRIGVPFLFAQDILLLPPGDVACWTPLKGSKASKVFETASGGNSSGSIDTHWMYIYLKQNGGLGRLVPVQTFDCDGLIMKDFFFAALMQF